jgi:class III poly(R)-hydroxyalkanoic acid synthase PhaE subunit
MTGFKESTEAWTKVWTEAQKQYLDTWTHMAQQGKGWTAPAWPGSNPWAEPMQQWSRMMTQALPRETRDVSTRLFELGKSYMEMGETFWRLMHHGQEIARNESDWQDVMRHFLSAACNFGRGEQDTDPWSGFATFWGLPLNTWQRFACSFLPFPGEMEKALRPDEVAQPSTLTRGVRYMMSMPPVGYTREWQEEVREWVQLYAEYTRALQEFGQLLGKVAQRAIELFSKKVGETLKEGKSLEGVREAYNLWIDCGEDAYAEIVATPDFPHLQAEMVNALMRLKHHEQGMMDEVMTALNMPTRREMDTAHRRTNELRQQLRALQDSVEELSSRKNTYEERAAESRAAAAVEAAPAARPKRKTPSAGKKTAAVAARSHTKRRVQPKTKKG